MWPRERIHHMEKTEGESHGRNRTQSEPVAQYASWGAMDMDPKLQAFKSSSIVVAMVTRASTSVEISAWRRRRDH